MSRLPSFALCGEVDGVRRTWLLGPGLNRIGSRLDGDVVLAVPGISRRHALLAVEPGRFQLEDLGSKNGTFVNGLRVESGRIELGDRLRLGSVTLRLEELSAADGELAIPGIDAAGAARFPESTQVATAGALPFWNDGLAWLDAFVATLPPAPGGSRSAALALVAERLEAAGAAVLENRPDGLAVLAATGEPPAPRILARAFAEPTAEALPLAVARQGDHALVAWGEFPGRERAAPLLTLLLRLLTREEAAAAPPRPARLRLAPPTGWLPGSSPAMRTLARQMGAVAGAELPILILGETGAGKEGVARTLHASSPRRAGPFVALNCAALPRDLLEAELFGIGRGVATGVAPRPGRFQAANGGTLLLDEIGDMPAELQAKLLRALQEKEVQPLGSGPVAVDARVLAATNAGLDRQLQEGTFRSDLYYRLAGCVLRVPPLRERREDIPALVEHFLEAAAREAGKSIRGITAGALARLVAHPWPGNVRQLENEVRRLVWLAADGEAIVAETLEGAGIGAPADAAEAAPAGGLGDDLDLDRLEQRAVAEALRRTDGNQSKAAELLGITRTSLYRRLLRHGLEPGGPAGD